MPITQERMLALIESARAFESATDKLIAIIEAEFHATRYKQRNPAAALEQIKLAANKNDLLFPHAVAATATLAVEAAHFKTARARNDAQRRWQERRRNGEIVSAAPRPRSAPKAKPKPLLLHDDASQPAVAYTNARDDSDLEAKLRGGGSLFAAEAAPAIPLPSPTDSLLPDDRANAIDQQAEEDAAREERGDPTCERCYQFLPCECPIEEPTK